MGTAGSDTGAKAKGAKRSVLRDDNETYLACVLSLRISSPKHTVVAHIEESAQWT
jgi:hypothetical protein